MAATAAFKNIRDLQIGGRGRVPVRVFHTEHAHKVWRPTFYEVRMLRTENSYSQSSSSSDLKVPITKIKSAYPGIELPVFLYQISFCLWLIFAIFSEFLTGFWKPFCLQCSIQYKLNLLHSTFTTRYLCDKELRQRFEDEGGSQSRSFEKL